jgi:Trk K+ transport system NAD-binding subunit
VAAIRRGDSVSIADEDLVVESGDILVAAVKQGSEARLRVFLAEEDRP